MESKEQQKVVLSTLGKTWILDLDGTIVKHNGYLIEGEDSLLEGAGEFLKNLPQEDMLIFITSRAEREREKTETFLLKNQIRWTSIIFGAPYGERILINDKKPSGLKTAVAINTERDEFCKTIFEFNEDL